MVEVIEKNRVILTTSKFKIGAEIASIDPFKHFAPHSFEIAQWLYYNGIPPRIVVLGVQDSSMYSIKKYVNPLDVVRCIKQRIDCFANLDCSQWYKVIEKGLKVLDNWIIDDYECNDGLYTGESRAEMVDYVKSLLRTSDVDIAAVVGIIGR